MLVKKKINTIVNPMMKFAMDSFSTISSNKTNRGNNLVYSPYSLYIVLCILLNGASSSVADAISETINTEQLTLEKLNAELQLLLTQLNNDDPIIDSSNQNTLILSDKIPMLDSFMKRVRDAYNVSVEYSLGEDFMMIVNKTSFQGKWSLPFKDDATKKRPFYLASGDSKQCQMMSASGRTCRYYQSETYEVLRLPYGQRRVAMYLFLPDKSSSLPEFLSQLSPNLWRLANRNMFDIKGTLYLPTFEVSTNVDLKDNLKALGMSDAFVICKNGWDLMTNETVCLQSVKQEAKIKVDTEGTVATAITQAQIELPAFLRGRKKLPPTFHFDANRPFFYMIHDEQTDVPLFMGVVTDPTKR